MTEEDVKAGIAKAVCLRFINMRRTTSRHAILVEFECPDVLDEMEGRNLISASERRDNFRPTLGTFALLGDDHELYQRARAAFERTIYGLWNLYRCEGNEVDHEAFEFANYTNKLYCDSAPFELTTLGLYLAREFVALQPTKMSADQLTVESFRVTEQVIRMRNPRPWWENRVQASREPFRPRGGPIDVPRAAVYEGADEENDAEERFSQDGFWALIHPAVMAEARPRFEAGHYADAVEWALKVVSQEVRRRTGLTVDGAELMHKAFSPKQPCLVFEDSIPSTQTSMQQGYMEIFAGAMSGVRNPKAHGMVQLDRRRCIHFLFLASLLADKIDEAADVP